MYSSKYAPKAEGTSSPAPPATANATKSPPPSQTEAAAKSITTTTPAAAPDSAPPVTSSIPAPVSYSMDPAIDEFAQTRPPDDLFDDDFTPVAESQLVYDPPPPAPVQQSVPAPQPQPQQQFREPRFDSGGGGDARGGRDLPRGVPRGPRGGRGGRGRGAVAPRSPPKQVPVQAPATTAETNGQATEGAEAAEDAKVDDTVTSPTTATSPPASAPTGPAAATAAAAAAAAAATGPKPTPSVRGDRSLTGGPAKKKLTETELNEKLAAMSLKNKALTEAHEKALADQDAFAAREKKAAERRRVEKVERQAMMGEREANRQRKMKALGGREWDSEKREEDFREEGRRARRGAHGGVTGARGDAVAQVGVEAEGEGRGYEGGQRGRGRGGRGGRGGGRGRGDHANNNSTPQQTKTQSIPTPADFPDLPITATPAKGTGAAPKDLDFPNKKKDAKPAAASETPSKIDTNTTGDGRPKLDTQTSFGFTPTAEGEKRSWADQMDATSP